MPGSVLSSQLLATALVVTLLSAGSASAERPAAAPPNQEQLPRRDTRIHDPSTIVKCEADYWLFATGRGVISRRSQNLTHWEDGPSVFRTPPVWTTNIVPGFRGYFWAPDVIQVSNRFLLYYSVSSWGKNKSAIGLATSPTLNPNRPEYRWSDAGIVIQSRDQDEFNAIDPSVFRDADGSLWLAFGSFWSGLKLIQLDPATGLRAAPDSPIYPLAHHTAIEAPCLFRRGDHYYLLLNWGQCCRGTNSTYNLRIGRSSRVTGPYLDKENVDLLRGGGSLFLETRGTFVGPGHAAILSENGIDRLSCHFYDGARGGAPTLALLPLRWTADGWPESAPPP